MQDELLLVETFRELFSAAWSHLQWWASISFGLLALASFGRKHLGLVTTCGLSVLYVLFTAFIFNNIGIYLKLGFGAMEQLQILSESGTIGVVGKYLSDTSMTRRLSIFTNLLGQLCLLFTFVGTLAYLWYSFFRNRRNTA